MNYKFKIFLGDSEISEVLVPSEMPDIQFGFHYGENKVIPVEWLYKWEDEHCAPFHHNIPPVIEDWERENEKNKNNIPQAD